MVSSVGAEKEMNLRYAGRCSLCGGAIPQGARAIYSTVTHTVRHIDCVAGVDLGRAGASAEREYERRKANDDARIAEREAEVQAVFGTGVLGKVATLLAVDDRPRRSTQVWRQGAVGEEKVAEHLDRLSEVGVVALHDRRIPGTRANIDHVAITPWGVWVIDAKRYLNRRPDCVFDGGFFGIGAVKHLTVGGRKRDNLVDGVLRQVQLVVKIVDDGVQVRGALAFVDADWPLIGGDFNVRGIAVLWPGRLAKVMLRQQEPTIDIAKVARVIAAAFPPA